MRTITENLDLIKQSMYLTKEQVRDNDCELRLIAVSKFIEIPKILEAYEAGQRIFGENRVQELQNKKDKLPSDIEWHMIGHLQANKVKAAVNASHLIHSVDSARILKRINETASAANKRQNILIQVNISGEDRKYGIQADLVEELLTLALDLDWVNCRGFMTITPQSSSKNETCSIYSQLRILKDSLEEKFRVSLPELSMGMSSDYQIAIREGATLIRIGTAIFGARNHE